MGASPGLDRIHWPAPARSRPTARFLSLPGLVPCPPASRFLAPPDAVHPPQQRGNNGTKKLGALLGISRPAVAAACSWSLRATAQRRAPPARGLTEPRLTPGGVGRTAAERELRNAPRTAPHVRVPRGGSEHAIPERRRRTGGRAGQGPRSCGSGQHRRRARAARVTGARGRTRGARSVTRHVMPAAV